MKASTAAPPRYNYGMERRQEIIDDPLAYLRIKWRHAVIFIASLIAAVVAVFSTF